MLLSAAWKLPHQIPADSAERRPDHWVFLVLEHPL